jgi:hypothetical protein
MDGGNTKSLESYEDLVFSPLALPSPPKVDTESLVAWMTWAREEGLKRAFNLPERGYEARRGRPYPWLMAVVYYMDRSNVEDSFEKEFPELAMYARQFPVNEVGGITLLAQRPNAAVRLHTDPDGCWGFRFRLGNGGPDGLHFCTSLRRTRALPPAMDDWSSLLALESKHSVRWPKGNLPYCLNSMRAAHAVDSNCPELGERIEGMVFPRYGLNGDKLLSLLDKSTAQFRESQLWYKEPATQAVH